MRKRSARRRRKWRRWCSRFAELRRTFGVFAESRMSLVPFALRTFVFGRIRPYTFGEVPLGSRHLPLRKRVNRLPRRIGFLDRLVAADATQHHPGQQCENERLDHRKVLREIRWRAHYPAPAAAATAA